MDQSEGRFPLACLGKMQVYIHLPRMGQRLFTTEQHRGCAETAPMDLTSADQTH
jgi:hypothetical protein